MSWDILIMDLPSDATSVSTIPDDFKPEPLGARSELIDMIREVAPASEFADPSWGELVTSEFVIEFNLGPDEIVDSIMLHVRGGGPAVAFTAARSSAGLVAAPSTAPKWLLPRLHVRAELPHLAGVPQQRGRSLRHRCGGRRAVECPRS